MKTHEHKPTSKNDAPRARTFKIVKQPTVLHRGVVRFLAAASVAVLCVSTSVAQNLTAGLVANYPFNGNANDTSGNGNHGVPVNGAHLTTDKHGMANSAFEFDGIDDYIDITNSASLTFTNGGFTLAVWASFSTSTNGTGALVAKHVYSSPPGFVLGTYSNQTLVQFFMSDSRLLTESRYDDGLWHFMVATHDGIAQRLYVDGVLKTSVSATYTPEESVDISIGRATGGGYFKGKIDDIRIYNRALSADEVRELYILDADTSSGLVAHYPFDGNATNILGTGNDGVVNGATLTLDRSGIANSAYAFIGSDDISVANGPPVATNASLTYAFWMLSTLEGAYPTNPPNTWRWFVDRTGVTTPLYSLGMLTDAVGTNSQGQFWYLPRYDDATQPPGSNELGAGIVGGLLTPHVWQHIAMVREYSNSFKLYVDGILAGSAPDNGKGLTLPPVVLGRNPNHSESGLVGKFDDFRIYNRALTPYDATALYYDGPPWLKAVPSAPVVSSGGNADFCLTAIGSLPLSYQWSFNGSALTGQTGSCLSLTSLQASQAGIYSITVTNAHGTNTFLVALSLLDLKRFAGLLLAGPEGSNYRIEFLPALGGTNTWQTLTNVILTTSPSVFFDMNSPNYPMRFYRAVPLP